MLSFAGQNILVLGDSLSAGYGIESGKEWASLLQKKLLDTKYDYRIINRSISGDTTYGGLERIGDALRQYKPSIVIIALGANDGLRGLSLSAMKSNLQSMIDLARKEKTRVLLVGMRLPSNYGAAYTKLFHDQFHELAETNAISFLPFLLENVGENLHLFQADGLHPTADAQPVIRDNVWAALLPLLDKRDP